MARLPGRYGPSRARRAAQTGRRLWPLVLMGWERWQSLSDDEKARYRAKARDYVAQGRKGLGEMRKRRPRR